MLRSLKDFARRATGRRILVQAAPNQQTLDFLATTDSEVIGEVGIGFGATSEGILRHLNGRGVLHIFDFESVTSFVGERLKQGNLTNFVVHSNTDRTHDSYNWSLMKALKDGLKFDYVFLDGAHTWAHDALAFFLIDRMLKVDGHLDFDDYGWTIDRSPTVNPRIYPANRKLYTEEQMQAQQVKLVVDLLVRASGRYEEVVADKIFRKLKD